MKKAKIIGYATDICWWQGCLNQIVPVLDEYEPTGYVKVRVQYEERSSGQTVPIEGWIEPAYLEYVK